MFGKTRGVVAAMTLGAALSAASVSAQERDIVDTAIEAGGFETLAAALTAADLVSTLKGEGPFTVFAPTDEAFAQLPAGTVEDLLRPENRDALVAVLTYHVVPGRVTADQVVELDRATTVNGADVSIRVNGGHVRINDSNVIATDIMATNGVIHVIDQVLLPEMDEEARTMRSRDEEMMRRATDVLALAIDRGVPLFNDGHASATAGIYEVGMQAVLMGGYGLPRSAERALERGLRDGRHQHDMRDRAWAYRRAMDRALDEIDGRMARRSTH